MHRVAAFRPVALLVVLSVMLMGAGVPHASCGGACCGSDRGASQARAGQAPRLAQAHACCCGPEAVPCDLEQAPAPDLPDSALTAVPRVDAPAPLCAVLAVAVSDVVRVGHAPSDRIQASAQGPPGPLYLRTQAFLC